MKSVGYIVFLALMLSTVDVSVQQPGSGRLKKEIRDIHDKFEEYLTTGDVEGMNEIITEDVTAFMIQTPGRPPRPVIFGTDAFLAYFAVEFFGGFVRTEYNVDDFGEEEGGNVYVTGVAQRWKADGVMGQYTYQHILKRGEDGNLRIRINAACNNI